MAPPNSNVMEVQSWLCSLPKYPPTHKKFNSKKILTRTWKIVTKTIHIFLWVCKWYGTNGGPTSFGSLFVRLVILGSRSVQNMSHSHSLSPWWCGGTRSGPWSRRCRSWSRGWWASGRCSERCYCGPVTVGSSSRLSGSPSSTDWWCAHLAAARSPLCGWTHPGCGASDDHSNQHLVEQTEEHRHCEWGWVLLTSSVLKLVLS